MVVVIDEERRPLDHEVLRSMFEARKQVFVDLLKWEVPVVEGRYELDQFDDEQAIYVIVASEQGEHLGSARLLRTVRPHILDTLFPDLCAEMPPRGPEVLEVTRFCLGRNQSAAQRLLTRNRLVTALVEFALAKGVTTYPGVADLAWLQQILAFGWRCRPLGIPQMRGGKMLGSLRIDITHETPGLLARTGLYTPVAVTLARELEAA